MKRIEDLLKDSSALKAHLVSNLQDLNNSFSELINFGISLAQQIMPYLNDVRGSKTPFQFEHVLSLVRQTASSTVNKGSNAPSPWQGVSDYIANVLQQASALVPLTMESGNTLKSTCGLFSLPESCSRICSHRNPTVGHSGFRGQGPGSGQRRSREKSGAAQRRDPSACQECQVEGSEYPRVLGQD